MTKRRAIIPILQVGHGSQTEVSDPEPHREQSQELGAEKSKYQVNTATTRTSFFSTLYSPWSRPGLKTIYIHRLRSHMHCTMQDQGGAPVRISWAQLGYQQQPVLAWSTTPLGREYRAQWSLSQAGLHSTAPSSTERPESKAQHLFDCWVMKIAI